MAEVKVGWWERGWGNKKSGVLWCRQRAFDLGMDLVLRIWLERREQGGNCGIVPAVLTGIGRGCGRCKEAWVGSGCLGAPSCFRGIESSWVLLVSTFVGWRVDCGVWSCGGF